MPHDRITSMFQEIFVYGWGLTEKQKRKLKKKLEKRGQVVKPTGNRNGKCFTCELTIFNILDKNLILNFVYFPVLSLKKCSIKNGA